MKKFESFLAGTNSSHTYIIAEVGQNHNGDMQTAKQLIDMAAMPIFDSFDNSVFPGVDAVKFTKRDLEYELTDAAMQKPYDSPHSYGKTYGEHRKALELAEEQHAELQVYAASKGLDFIETICAPASLKMLSIVDIQAIKVASRDLDNAPLLIEMANTGKPIILSTGMVTYGQVDEALDILKNGKSGPVAILHCISEYPAKYQNINLVNILEMKKRYPEYIVGYSDHSKGIVVPSAAVALGAKIIEKHITLNRSMKGADHEGSLEPEGLWRMVRDIRNIERSLGVAEKIVPQSVVQTRTKLARSLSSSRFISKGQTISLNDLCMLSPGDGLPWRQRDLVLGKTATVDIPNHTTLNLAFFK